MNTTNTAEILVPEILAHLAADTRPIAAGDLIVAIDYAGREVGVRVTDVMGDTVIGSVTGLIVPEPYRLGDTFARPIEFCRRAV